MYFHISRSCAERLPVIWATNHLGDTQVSDIPTALVAHEAITNRGRHILFNWATEVETTGPQLWKCERLTIAVLEQLRAVHRTETV